MIRTVRTRFGFNGLPKGYVFTYDPETDTKIVRLIEVGILQDVTPETPKTIIFEMPSIESDMEFGVIGGEGEDQSSGGPGEGSGADDAGSPQGLQGDEGTLPKVAKKR